MLPKGIKRNSQRNKREEERNVLKVMEPVSRALKNQKEAEVEAVPGLRGWTKDVLPSSVIIWMLVPLLLS